MKELIEALGLFQKWNARSVGKRPQKITGH